MRLFLGCLLMLGACNTMEALQDARSPAEAYYLLKKKDGDKSVNPYDGDPDYQAVYCRVEGMEFRSTVSACADANGKAVPVN